MALAGDWVSAVYLRVSLLQLMLGERFRSPFRSVTRACLFFDFSGDDIKWEMHRGQSLAR